MDQIPEISIIVPVYKVERYLDRCVRSILAQTFTRFELILVDDGSPDACPNMCDDWAKKDIRIKVIHKDNGGLSSARNAGLEAAFGRYICFVDSDDWLETDAIQYLRGLLLRTGTDFVVGAFRRTDGLDKKAKCGGEIAVHVVQPIEEVFTGKDFIRKLLRIEAGEPMPYAWGKFYKRELFEDLYYPVGSTSEDWPVTFACALKSNTLAISDKVVYNYYNNPDSLSNCSFGPMEFDMIKSADMILKYAHTMTSDDEIRKWAALHRKRASFAVLADLMIKDGFRKNEKEFAEEVIALRKELSDNLPELLGARMALYRKIIMLFMCYAWHPTADLINIVYNRYRERMKRLLKK